MRAPGEILLISCYELGQQPLTVAGPLGALERAGFSPAALDLSVERFDPARVGRARLVAIAAPMHTALRLAARAIARVREHNPAAQVVVYGMYAALNAERLLAAHADYVIGPEAEEPLVSLARALESGGDAPEGVQSRARPVAWPVHKPRPGLPSRAALPALARYAKLVRAGREPAAAGAVAASRGCLHRCAHCPVTPLYRGRFFVVPREMVLDDVARLVEAGASHVTFADPDFMNGPRHSMDIVREMHRRWPHLTFDATIKVEHILEHAALFPELGASGCAFVVSAVEALSDRVLAELRKGHTVSDVYAALEVCRAAGVPLRPTFVAFTPWTTPEDYLELCAFVEHEVAGAVDPVQLAIRLLIPPGSALLQTPGAKPWLGPLAPDGFAHQWTHPDPRMDALADEVRARVAAAAGEAPAATIAAVRVLAEERLGMQVRARRGNPAPAEAPRLTEPWFCCAEPTDTQLAF